MDSVTTEQVSSQRITPGSINLPVISWPATATDPAVDAGQVAENIIAQLNKSITDQDYRSVAELFHEDGYWRDHLALSWDFQTMKGKDSIVTQLDKSCSLGRVEIDRTSAWRSPTVFPFDGIGEVKGIQFYTTFSTEVGSGRGIVRLAEEEGLWKIWAFYTCLEKLRDHEESVGPRRAKGVEHGAELGRKNWLDRREEDSNFVNGEPDVLIIGAGQAGLTAHARLKMLNVSALIIDRNDAIGDNWRKRYHQLVLHDPVWFDHLPYLKFPDTWPVFTPKDKLAEWFESYAKILELNVWTRATPERASWDDTEKEWTVTIKRTFTDGRVEERTLHPKHIIQATGHAGKEYFPDINGRDNFQGDVLCHSAQFPGARSDREGKKAVVIGACNSSHDICQDYYEKGYDVTMVQRSTTCVVSSEAATDILLAVLYEEGGPPTEDSDIWLWGMPAEILKTLHRNLTKLQVAKDAEILDGLQRVGFQLDDGPDDCGLFMKYLQRGGGYYFDVGASKLIIDGKIRVKQGRGVEEILPHGVRLTDGTELEADEIIFATGYENMRTQTRSIFGDEIADQVTDIWGFDDRGEIRTLWRKSGHPRFWVHGGNLAMCRYFSRLLALQIKAQLLGLA